MLRVPSGMLQRAGQRFLFIQPHLEPNAPIEPITVVVSWQTESAKR